MTAVIEGRHGFAGVPRAWGAWGHVGAPTMDE